MFPVPVCTVTESQSMSDNTVWNNSKDIHITMANSVTMLKYEQIAESNKMRK